MYTVTRGTPHDARLAVNSVSLTNSVNVTYAGHEVADRKDPQHRKEGSPDNTANTAKRAEKGRAEGGSTFVRDFYTRSAGRTSVSNLSASPFSKAQHLCVFTGLNRQ